MLLEYVVYEKAIQSWSYFNGVDLIPGEGGTLVNLG